MKKDCIYLVTGQDACAKDKVISEIKSRFLPSDTSDFNLDTVYARDITLKDLQEKLLYIPVSGGRRVIVIRQAGVLKKEIKDFLENYAKGPNPSVVLVLEMDEFDRKDKFSVSFAAHSVLRQLSQEIPKSVFALSDEIRAGKAGDGLKLLHDLLKKGQKPELILGGLRSGLSRNAADISYLRRLNKLLLDCDTAIKTGSLKPSFALERLVVSLCAFKQTFR